MASKRRNMFHKNKTQETTEKVGQSTTKLLLRVPLTLIRSVDRMPRGGVAYDAQKEMFYIMVHKNQSPVEIHATFDRLFGWEAVSLGTCFAWYFRLKRGKERLLRASF
ncbi:hypothetical protein AAG570_013568 [Ranatra chinensis]|uniref:Uncharacterized protein n=1 Tax=Ranatra chinensis TaxID=642074 RepID=A0ABD0YCU9_9HEMI